MVREYHVAINGNDKFDGTKEKPFRTIQAAANKAMPGDTVTVHEGVYRECVSPHMGGISENCRITYQAAAGEKVVIKGSEVVKNWENIERNVWKAVLKNDMFGDYNPYKQEIFGDWFIYPEKWKVHTGEVYLNGKSFYEARSLEEVRNPVMRTEGFNPRWECKSEPVLHPEDTLYQWYAETDEENTVIYANFQGFNPNDETVEINVRMSCFYPEETGKDYITVRGFEMAQAATTWAPPTADQRGLIGPHWSKGWIIENNIIHDAKCSGISIGKEKSTGDNDCSKYHRKPGYQYQMEAVFKALNIGWSKENIGSHIIRNNVIFDCGQTAIVGHLGCVFSQIYNNHIYNIAVKHEYYGFEIAGIKLHAGIDVQIHDNNIHDCSLGVWLDWQAQGARVSKNLFYNNNRDIFIEVTHGPHLVDNNIFASKYFIDNVAWGGAFVNNLICGSMRHEPVLNRATPYHYPHSTRPMGTTFVYSGDDRWYQNIFVGGEKIYSENTISGTSDYNGSPCSHEEFVERVLQTPGDLEVFREVKEAVYLENNAYLNSSTMFDREQGSLKSNFNPDIKIKETNGKTYLEINVNRELLARKAKILKTEDLGSTRITEMCFENPDGSPITFDTDYNGDYRNENAVIGPLSRLHEGKNIIEVFDEENFATKN